MKILFFVSSLNAGGAERVAVTLANAWAQRGDDVELVPTYLAKRASFYPLNDAVNVVWLSDQPARRWTRILPGLGKWWLIRDQVRRSRPDVIVSFLTNVNVNVLIATMGMPVPVPVIVSERTNPLYSQSAGKLLQFLRRVTYRRARFVVMQTQASVTPFKAMVPGLHAVTVIPNPLPPALPIQDPRPTNVSQRRIMAMGRLVPTKQFDVLIDAFARLAPMSPDWTLTIWGDGPLRDTLTHKIGHMGLQDRVFLAGRTPEPWQALSQADIFAMTSRVEGFPNVLLEAMALGLPCVALDCPSGPAELTRNGQDAVLVPLGQPDALVRALQDLMMDESRRHELGAQAAESVRRNYGLPRILAQWDDLFARAPYR